MMSVSIIEDRRKLDFARELASFGWYHSMNFPDGEIIEGFNPLHELSQRYADFRLPDDLRGRRALDIGAWDGWFSFELERHGAAVTAIDLVEVKNFLYARERLKSKVTYIVSDVYDIPQLNLEPFDYVLFLGVLYHLRHPLLALETVCSLTTETAAVDSFVIDSEDLDDTVVPPTTIPFMEFYETDELGRNIDNWFGPTTECLMALCRSAGFARVEYVNTLYRHARVLCHRKWEPAPRVPTCAPPVLSAALHTRNYGVNFRAGKEEYVTCWFTSPIEHLDRRDLRPEISGFGAPALSLSQGMPGHFATNVLLPPGLQPGRHAVRLRTAGSEFSGECHIFVDLPVFAGPLEILRLGDGVSWRENVSVTATGRFACLYAGGLADNTDTNNLAIVVDDIPVKPEFVGNRDENGLRQVNVQVPQELPLGKHQVVLKQSGRTSNVEIVDIVP